MTGEAYEFRLAAFNQEGWSDWSQIVTIIASETPGAPLHGSVVLNREQGTALLSWQASDARGAIIQEYVIELKNQGGSFDPIECEFSIEPTQCVVLLSQLAVQGFTIGSNVVFRVYAVSNLGNSEMSQEFAKIIGFPPR